MNTDAVLHKMGRILCYPNRPQVQVFGTENLLEYQHCYNLNRSCKTCGVAVDILLKVPPEDSLEGTPEEKTKTLEYIKNVHPVNIRILEGVEWRDQPGDPEGEQVSGKVHVLKVNGIEFPDPPNEYDQLLK